MQCRSRFPCPYPAFSPCVASGRYDSMLDMSDTHDKLWKVAMMTPTNTESADKDAAKQPSNRLGPINGLGEQTCAHSDVQ